MDAYRFHRLARTLNDRHFKDLVFNRLVFTAAEKSISLLSTNPMTPQQSIRRIGTENGAERILKQVLQGKRALKASGRNTEKRQLQTWIIRESFQGAYKAPFGTDITFLGADVTVPRSRICADLVGVDSQNRLVLFELSDKRQKNSLQRRMATLTKWAEDNVEYFTNWLLLGHTNGWNKKVRRIVVWPAKRNDKKEKWDNEIEEYTYEKRPQNEFLIR